jgi:hypothetical protein
MTFLAPALLALGLAVAVPLALHLLQRHQGPRFVFPAVRYLRRAEREHATRLRLRQVLLLALRVLAILLLAAAAARPFLPAAGPDHPPTSVVIILDNSLASGAVVDDRRVLDHLRDAALQTVGRAGPDDRIWLIRAGQPWEPAVRGELDAVAAAVRGTEPSPGLADLAAELERAASILATEPAGRAAEIHVLSDLRYASAGAPATVGDVPILVLEPPARLDRNRAVTAVEVGGGIAPRAGVGSVVTARIEGFGRSEQAESPDSVDARLVVDGVVRGVVRTSVGSVVSLPLPAADVGLVTGRVEIDADALAGDDRRHFVSAVLPPPTVLLTEPMPFLEEAMDVLAEAGRIRRGGPGAVVVAPGALGADALQRGASIIVIPPASPLELAAANQRLGAAGVPWRFDPPGPGEARLDPRDTGMPGLLEDVRLRQVYGLDPIGEPGDTVLLRLRTGEPWAVAGEAEAGRYVLLASPLTLEGGTLPTSAAMVPLLDRAINAWALGAPAAGDHRPGAVVTLPAGDSVLRPDGSATLVPPESMYRLTEAGIYRVVAGDSVVAAFAVNAAPEASDVRAMTGRSAAALLAGSAGRAVSARAWADAVYQRRLGRDITLALLLGALLVLLAEAAVAAAGRPDRRAAAPAAGAGAPDAARSPSRSTS